ncbi:kynurenine/alpha-aminoadipate aminotransferase, mitochondrial-like isoform X2 [Dreissena polymorpha]|uniref:kynurenine/alpha-aminoadipate aminotransferase, mitochondrial-like isoform X2 n=1 Tax=Dreissena polymorpha TaxID=45954 RepID=UPI00226524B3|nr:kynurenine/alpha-aminoadipate aminotransferase, mitochondrial-like isoform X2 [Dreissena polymorpha]
MSGMDFSPFFSKVAARVVPSPLREFFDALQTDETYIKLAGGLPEPELFPLKSVALTLPDGTNLEISSKDLVAGLQYDATAGRKELIVFLTDLTKRLHDPPTWRTPGSPDAHCIMTSCGAQDGQYKVLDLLLNEGDIILAGDYVYPNVLAVIIPRGCSVQHIHSDEQGIMPDHLEAYLRQWPKPGPGQVTGGKIKPLYKSFLSLDVEGRVVRLDTFSKTLAPGFRVGYVTAPHGLYRKLVAVSQTSTQGTSNLCQTIILTLLRKWGIEGFLAHCENIGAYYRRRREACERIAKKHLTGLADWRSPSGGMFLWVRFLGVQDSMPLVMGQLLERKCLMVTGSAFVAGTDARSPYVRISFSLATDRKMEEGFAIIAEELKKIREDLENKEQ